MSEITIEQAQKIMLTACVKRAWKTFLQNPEKFAPQIELNSEQRKICLEAADSIDLSPEKIISDVLKA